MPTPVARGRLAGISTEDVESDPKIARIWEIAEPVALEAGLELVDIEHRREGRGTVLRLLIDRRRDSSVDSASSAPAAPATPGVSIDELADMSRQISDLLD